jgi:hypothetical protein
MEHSFPHSAGILLQRRTRAGKAAENAMTR